MPTTDAAFFIGKTHTVCQDYALAPSASLGGRVTAAWLSDGCSSSPHTDIGARLLVHTMQTKLQNFASVFGAKNTRARRAELRRLICETVSEAQETAARLGVVPHALDATLLALVYDANTGILHAAGWGDGALILGFDNGTRTIYRAQFGAGYPFYPAYETDANRRKQWEAVPSNAQTITKTRLRPDGIVENVRDFSPTETGNLLRVRAKGLRFAAVVSDGAESFQKREPGDTSAVFAPISYSDVLREMTAFKQFKGDFVQRRMQAFIKNCAKMGWHHNDDLSMAALFFGDE